MAKPAGVTRNWIVYPPNYKPGDGYIRYKSLKKAWNKALSLGPGACVDGELVKWNKRYRTTIMGDVCYEVPQK